MSHHHNPDNSDDAVYLEESFLANLTPIEPSRIGRVRRWVRITWHQTRRQLLWPRRWVQRAARGYSDEDAWDLDLYLASWLPDALEQLRDYGKGYPGHLTPEEWEDILSRMADGFRIMPDLLQNAADSEQGRTHQAQAIDAVELLCQFYWYLQD